MCTATWRGTADGYTVCFNRDESRERASESPVHAFRRGGVECLAPFDAAGGTWIGVNELGFAACLLNAYPEQDDPGRVDLHTPLRSPRAPRSLSRGFLVLGLLDATSVDAARRRVNEGDLRWFQPFRLLAFAPGEAPVGLTWDGHRLVEESLAESSGMICSSGWNDARARAARRKAWDERFEDRPPEEHELLDFHRSHAATLPSGPCEVPVELAAGAESVCMHRPDACTVSFARVRVGGDRVALWHGQGQPCKQPGGSPQSWGIELDLARRVVERRVSASGASSASAASAASSVRPRSGAGARSRPTAGP